MQVLQKWEVEELRSMSREKFLINCKARLTLTYRSCCELTQNGDSKQSLSKFSVIFQADADMWLGMSRVGA